MAQMVETLALIPTKGIPWITKLAVDSNGGYTKWPDTLLVGDSKYFLSKVLSNGRAIYLEEPKEEEPKEQLRSRIVDEISTKLALKKYTDLINHQAETIEKQSKIIQEQSEQLYKLRKQIRDERNKE